MAADFDSSKGKKNSDFLRLVNSLSLFQKVTLGLVVVIVVAGLIMLIRWSNKPEYAVLYNGLTNQEAASVVEILDQSNFSYQVSDDGSVIRINKNELADARLALASEGLPYNSVTGFELFDQQFFGLTDFTQKVNYQRALEGELARTISQIEEIESSRVHLVLSEEELFTDQFTDSSASIVVKLRSNKLLPDESVIAIKNLVANAVKSLNIKDISIMDTNGNLLTAGGQDSHNLSEQQKYISEIETGLENKINNMLIKLLGAGNSIVRVKAELDTDVRQSESETYLPGENGQGVILDQNVVTESYDQDQYGQLAEGEAGTDSNVPLLEDEEEDIPVYGEVIEGEEDETNIYQRSEQQTKYGVSRRIETTTYGTGDISRLSVGVFLNSGLTTEQIEDIEAVIVAAAGIDASRGDTLSIRSMEFAGLEPNLETAIAPETGGSRIWDILSRAWPAVLLLLLIIFLTLRSTGWLKFKRNKSLVSTRQEEWKKLLESKEPEQIESGPEEEEKEDKKQLQALFGDQSKLLSREEKRKKIMEIREKIMSKMDDNIYPELKEVISMESDENPETAAKVIKNWLLEKS
ncbi:MAG: flagellar basal-body MS-ring/collar protein FliF [Actinomycetota bacterium]|nr:flagellar basal-body MS-ring/collar protein FliF [Actinomycetota bacterium]